MATCSSSLTGFDRVSLCADFVRQCVREFSVMEAVVNSQKLLITALSVLPVSQ